MRSYYTSSTLFAFKYSTGIIIATDTQLSYGRLNKNEVNKIFILGDDISKSRNTVSVKNERIIKESGNICKNITMISSTGEYSDTQYLLKELKKENINTNNTLTPQGYHRYLQRIMYSKRSNMKNINNNIIVAGIEVNKKEGSKENVFDHNKINIHTVDNTVNRKDNFNERLFLGAVDYRGNFFYSAVLSFGIGAYIVTPYLRSLDLENTDKDKALDAAIEGLRLLYYRCTQSSNKVQIAVMDETGYEIIEELIDGQWELGRNVV
ncbi:Proteasome B-type subunit [Spraguea lophii 42_110]|uniref:Proteasome B-type subunit n=1 Tax=Spraguea lophii (strain 42_110) TaxID=1358809 RepID=S7W815_SPRLO|nr:Proteasome B-type subunit [Spraguea lophii 42_110]